MKNSRRQIDLSYLSQALFLVLSLSDLRRVAPGVGTEIFVLTVLLGVQDIIHGPVYLFTSVKNCNPMKIYIRCLLVFLKTRGSALTALRCIGALIVQFSIHHKPRVSVNRNQEDEARVEGEAGGAGDDHESGWEIKQGPLNRSSNDDVGRWDEVCTMADYPRVVTIDFHR